MHDIIAGINARGALDAFHLRAVADVDAGGTDRHALSAGDTVAVAFGLALFEGLAATSRAALLASLVVVGDDDGVLIE